MSTAYTQGVYRVSVAVASAFSDAVTAANPAFIIVSTRAIIFRCSRIVIASLCIHTPWNNARSPSIVAISVKRTRAVECKRLSNIGLTISISENLYIQYTTERATRCELQYQYLAVVIAQTIRCAIEDVPRATCLCVDREVLS